MILDNLPDEYIERLKIRFWSKVERYRLDDCWLWVGALQSAGYGCIGVGDARSVSAHRVSYELHRGPIPTGYQVLHHCDVRNCINPNHLFIGTHLDNMADMHDKGRGYKSSGEKSHSSKLTASEVKDIRYLYAHGLRSPKRLGAMYGVHHTNINKIVSRNTWKHI